jgi:preprotein translocase subunit SecF
MSYKGRFDIIGTTKVWLTLSCTVIGVGIIFMILNLASPQLNYGHTYPLKLGIDFTGGNVFKLVYSVKYTDVANIAGLQAEIHKDIDAMTSTIPLVQAGRNETGNLVIQIRTDASVTQSGKDADLKDHVLSIIQKENPGATLTDASEDYVGPVIGRELAYRGIMGLVLGSILILIYVSLRMYFDFAVCAVIALVHDVLVLCGTFAIVRLEIDSSFVAAVLTVVGYSINDTIIIFDRVRENTSLKKGMPFPDMVNLSLNQTMARSINTVLTTLLPLITLLLFGGPTIRNFILALFVGISSGAYSSIFNAAPLLVLWRARKRRKTLAAKELAFSTVGSSRSMSFKTKKPEPVKMSNDGSGSSSFVADAGDEYAGEGASSQKPTYGPGKSTKKKKKRKR